MMNKYMNNHPYHIVSNSPWPIIFSINLMNFIISNLLMMNMKNNKFLLIMMMLLIIIMMNWWKNLMLESLMQGFRTIKCKIMMKFSMILFILSEIMFFMSMFWCYMHMYLSPSIEIGSIWPPKNIEMFNPFLIPLINSIILITSGMTLTYSHYLMINNKFIKSIIYMYMTIILGMMFTTIQIYEYKMSFFNISDSIYGSIFFMLTGFHGLHVIIGTIFLITSLKNMYNKFSKMNNLSFELSSWYWHFVDFIWLMVYTLVYWWPY
uniref:Cytochrome c oxidase subunit 3 n=1 Tax=Diapriidae sp. ZJUH_2016010 TaxID=2491155 RepID=A0A3Q8U9Y5_9HYME|nr:cytochrome c oxidase subunit 3 [Diapriidae sp. ZJUH_2016010]